MVASDHACSRVAGREPAEPIDPGRILTGLNEAGYNGTAPICLRCSVGL